MSRSDTSRKLPSVLIIDDDSVSREVMATVLGMSGYPVHTAAQGGEAVTLIENNQCSPDVILMDIQMPGLQGADLIHQLRVRSDARIYAMSGSEAPARTRAGADGFLLKPFGLENLLRFLEQNVPAFDEATSGNAIISLSTLEQMRSVMPEAAVREIYDAVLSDLAQRTDALKSALTRRDAVEIRRLGHAIKGGCAMAGALEAASLGELLEHESDELDNTPALLRELEAATRDLQAMLKALFPAPGDSSICS